MSRPHDPRRPKAEEPVDAMEALLSRRSIRQYTAQPVPGQVIAELLEAAMSAPSAMNEQPWHFVVIRDQATREKIASFHPYAEMLRQAPVAILVCGDRQLERSAGCWVQDCSAATQNLLIAAHAKGLGAVWVGIYPREERVARMRQLLGLPASIIPLSLIPLGYPAEQLPRSQRYDPGRVHHGHW